MKRLKSLLPALALLLAVVSSFAFRTIEKKWFISVSCTWFSFTGTAGQEHDPTKYTQLTSEPTCSGLVNLCAVCVRSSQIYTSGDNNGLPMVDDSSKSIYTNINAALTTGNKHNVQIDDAPADGTFDEVVWLKS